MNEVISILDKKNSYAALWYISDHGETFIDEGCAAAGHGFGSKYNFQIPLIFWASEKYRNANNEIIKAAIQLKDKPVFSVDFFDTLMQMAGFEVQKGSFNGFMNANYKSPKRFVGTLGAAIYDYDQEYSNNACGK